MTSPLATLQRYRPPWRSGHVARGRYRVPVDARTALRGVGKTFITAGTLILLFVAYQLWGTGIAEARAQHRLTRELAARGIHATTSPVSAPPTTAPPAGPTTTAVPLPPPPPGGALAILTIPRIHIDAAVVEGVGVSDLKKGPGHYPKTPLPGQPGNTAIAGHRTTYGAPFYHLNEVAPDDDIFLSTSNGTFHYKVVLQHNVDPSDVKVIDPTPDNRLTLTTCTPRFTASQRLVVVARLIGPATVAPTAVPVPETSSTDPAAPDVSVGSLSGQGTSTWPAIGWGLVCALVWLVGFAWGRRWRRWPAYLLTTPVFLLALFVFFENFARFVPANI